MNGLVLHTPHPVGVGPGQDLVDPNGICDGQNWQRIPQRSPACIKFGRRSHFSFTSSVSDVHCPRLSGVFCLLQRHSKTDPARCFIHIHCFTTCSLAITLSSSPPPPTQMARRGPDLRLRANSAHRSNGSTVRLGCGLLKDCLL
jgi:hypothetical protein